MSFRRRAPPTRPSLPDGVTEASCGTRVVSSGVKGLDALLGGGLAIGRLTVVIEDGMTKLHAHVLSSVATTALSYSQALAIALPTAPAEDFLESSDKLPSNPTKPKNEHANPELSIAWRYATVTSNVPSASFKPASSITSTTTTAPIRRVSALGYPDVSIESLLASVTAHCQRANKEGVVSVVVVASLGFLWKFESKYSDFHSVLLELRALARNNRTAILVTLPNSIIAADAALSADAVVQLNALPPEERTSRAPDGVAVLEKAPHITPGVWLGKRGQVYAYRASRRGIALELATVEPEEEDNTTGCGSGGGGGKVGVDF